MYDLVIIGAGPAGMAAAVYAARQKISFAVISKDIGGQTVWSSNVENYLGFHLVTGSELVSKFQDHLKDYDVDFKREEVISLEKRRGFFAVKTSKKVYETKAVLIASGKIPRKLGVPDEDKYLGKGVTYCATCDAPVFAGKNVAIIGGGNSAMDAALLAEKYCKKVHLVNINPMLKGESQLVQRVLNSGKITVYNNSKTTEITGTKFAEGINFQTPNGGKTLAVQGVFIEIGSIPSVSFDKLTQKNKYNEIVLREDKKNGISNQTSVEGIFAAGDVTDVAEKQIIVAGGEGVKAVLGIFKFLQKPASSY